MELSNNKTSSGVFVHFLALVLLKLVVFFVRKIFQNFYRLDHIESLYMDETPSSLFTAVASTVSDWPVDVARFVL